jgi:hypothetical protein
MSINELNPPTYECRSFNEQKAVDAAVYLLQLNNATMPATKLLNLLYLADRAALSASGSAIVDGIYISTFAGVNMQHVFGFMMSNVHNTLKIWSRYISPLSNLEVSVIQESSYGELSDYTCGILKQVYDEHGKKSSAEVAAFVCSLPEWKDPNIHEDITISVRDILQAENWSDSDIKDAEEELAYYAYIDWLFGPDGLRSLRKDHDE